jgi:NAD(P)-dependent dehydrogenase (short-subunit alcohol dehydrogenase family)
MSGITIINGGTQGLGEAIARALAAKGADGLVLAGRSADRGNALANELTATGTPSLYVHVDARDDSAPRQLVEACKQKFGVPSGLVNVAALTTRATLWHDTPEHFQSMMKINVHAPYFMIQAVAKAMVESGVKGSIVNVGSVTGHGGQTKLPAYAISKGALSVMTKNLAFALMRQNVRVNQVNPGWMDTESEHRVQVQEDGAPENWLALAEPTRPMGRLVKPWEVANAIVFCLSEESGLLTGNVIDIDQSVQGAGDAPAPSAEETPQL